MKVNWNRPLVGVSWPQGGSITQIRRPWNLGHQERNSGSQWNVVGLLGTNIFTTKNRLGEIGNGRIFISVVRAHAKDGALPAYRWKSFCLKDRERNGLIQSSLKLPALVDMWFRNRLKSWNFVNLNLCNIEKKKNKNKTQTLRIILVV